MTIQGNLICPVTGTLFMELPELPISDSACQVRSNNVSLLYLTLTVYL